MRAKVKPEYDDETTLWAVVPALVICFFSSFVFWMSPLGLGFNDQALEKLRSDFIFDVFQIILWAGPVSILVGIILIIGGMIRPTAKLAIRRTMRILIGAIIISQISTLIYLVS